MGLYDDDKEATGGDLSGNQHFATVKAALDALANADNAALAKDAAKLRDVYDSLAKLVAQFPKHEDVTALAKRGAALIPDPRAVFRELADVAAHIARLKGLAQRDVPKPSSVDVVDAVRIAAEARRVLARVANLPGARELMVLVDGALREVHEKAGVAGGPGGSTSRGLGRKVALEIVLDKCTSMEIQPLGVCLGCDLRLTRGDTVRGMEIVVGCELKQRLTPPLRVAYSKRKGPGLLGMMTLAEHHYYFVEMYEELTADERAKIDPLIDRLYERYVERS